MKNSYETYRQIKLLLCIPIVNVDFFSKVWHKDKKYTGFPSQWDLLKDSNVIFWNDENVPLDRGFLGKLDILKYVE